jgi:hypothetical protein
LLVVDSVVKTLDVPLLVADLVALAAVLAAAVSQAAEQAEVGKYT